MFLCQIFLKFRYLMAELIWKKWSLALATFKVVAIVHLQMILMVTLCKSGTLKSSLTSPKCFIVVLNVLNINLNICAICKTQISYQQNVNIFKTMQHSISLSFHNLSHVGNPASRQDVIGLPGVLKVLNIWINFI